MVTYVAFLRGITVGEKKVTMDLLKEALASVGCQNVRTLFASGNVVFNSDQSDEKKLSKQLEVTLAGVFGFDSAVLLRPLKYIKELVQSDPFKKVQVSQGTRLNVSFLSPNTKSTVVVPYESQDKTFRIISMTQDELFTVITPEGKTTDAMELIEKKFGKKVTMRTWNTIKKIAQLESLPTSTTTTAESSST